MTSERGSVLTEYVVLLVTVSLPLALATMALGPAILRLYLTQAAVLFLPIPY